MKSTRRIASDARYMIASIALVTSMAIFASLGSAGHHEDSWHQSAVTPMEVTTTTSDDCTCGGSGGTGSAIVIDNSNAITPPQQAASPSDDCTCGESSGGGDATQTNQAQAASTDLPDVNIQSPGSFTVQTNINDSGTNVSINYGGPAVETNPPTGK